MNALRRPGKRVKLGDVFIGYEKDTASSIVLQVCTEHSDDDVTSMQIDIMDQCKNILLQVRCYS